MKRKCPNCGAIVESKFCTSCGQDLTVEGIVKICPNCGMETTSKFCTGCGTKMDEENDREDHNAVETGPASEEKEIPVGEIEKGNITASASSLYNAAKRIGAQKVKDLEQNAEARREQKEREKEREAEFQREKREREEELRRQELIRQEEERKRQLEKEQKEAQEREENERKKALLKKKRIYEEASAYAENAETADDQQIASEFYRKAETLFSSIPGWEDADERSITCARRAKECEILVEKQVIAKRLEQKEENEEPLIDEQGTNDSSSEKEMLEEHEPTPTDQADVATDRHDQEAPNKSKTKLIFIIAIIAIVVIAGVVFALSRGGSEDQSSEINTTDSSENNDADNEENDNGVAYVGDKIAIDDGIELKWDTGEAKLTAYQFERSSYEGDCVNLYVDFTNPSNEEQTMLNNLYIDVFQNGIELDEKTWTTTEEEDAGFTELQKGASIEAARGFILRDSSELTVRFSTFGGDDAQEAVMKLQVPKEVAKKIKGTPLSDAEEGEIAVKDGIILEGNSAKTVFTGYKLNDDESEITFFFDFTNLSNKPDDMANTVEIKPFQNGVELEYTGLSSTPSESHFFNEVEKGKTIHCGYAYNLKDKSELTLKLSMYDGQGDIEESQTLKLK